MAKRMQYKGTVSKTKTTGLIALLWCMNAAHSANAPSAADHSNQIAPPARVISLLPSLTESVCALGQCHRLVGVDRYSNYPESVKKLPQMGGGIDPNIEAVVALRPDIVLMAPSAKGHQRLRELGVRVLLLEPKTKADVQRSLTTLGELFKLPPPTGAQRVWRDIEQGIAAAARQVPPAVRGQTVYIEAGAPYAASEASFVGELLHDLGMRNSVPASLGAFPALNPEFIVTANPAFIMGGQAGLADMAARPGWGKLAAIRTGQVCAMTALEGDMVMRPGPRMVQAAQWMVKCLSVKSKPASQPASQ
jgi:iron complex transport system substrate-binding protein